MTFVRSPYIKNNVLEARPYQESIFATATKSNTLCVLPTGMGKTQVAIMLAAYRLQKYPDKKILMMAPTRPLCAQHQKAFQNYMDINEENVVLVTGVIHPQDRMHYYQNAQIILATPQTIQNDIKNGVIGLNSISLMIFDECHRAIRDYAYTYIAKMYSLNVNHLILGLTASPGGDESKIKQICDNLSIASVEIRTEKDSDVIEYVKQIDTEYVKVDLPDELKKAQDIMKLTLKHDMDELRRYDLNVRGMRDLLDAQKKVMNDIQTDKKPIYFHLVAQITKCIKVYHLLEMMETQSIKAARTYITKLRQKKTSSDKRVMNDVGILNAIKIIETYEKEHPKMIKIAEILEQQLALDKNFKIIVFSHFRDNIDSLESVLKEVKGCTPAILIGQSGEKGQTQKEQIDVIKDYEAGVYNCLITSPIGEEGLHLSSADIAIFYDSVASEIRTIQRRGRVGRTKLGKIIFLLTRNTRDETYRWVAENKEKKMKEILKGMQEDNNNDRGLMKFIKSA